MAAHLVLPDATPGGADTIVVSLGDKTFTAGKRTAAHIMATIEYIERLWPGCHVHIMQACYHRGYEPSAGTHDEDGVIDFRVYGMDGSAAQWWLVQAAFRRMGWDAYYRHTGSWASPSSWHVHAISEGCPGPVGDLIPQQDADYKNHRLALARSVDGPDSSWFPGDRPGQPTPHAGTVASILACRFDYAAWEEDHMDEATIQKLAEATAKAAVDALMAYKPGNDDDTVKQILNRLSTSQDRNPKG